MGWVDQITLDEVADIEGFAKYSQQVAGVPFPSKHHLNAANKQVNELFEMYPALTWKGLCQIPLWAKKNKKRYAHIAQLLNSYRYAYTAGYLPELDVVFQDIELERKIEKALLAEKDPEWRRRLMESRGDSRKKIYEFWAHRVDL